jgi:hypothetical protein
MSAPARGTVIVAVGQLRADARSWSEAADEHAMTAGWLTQASLQPLEFGPIGRLRDHFETARVQLERIVADGGLAAATVSRTLTAAADAYLLDELENVHAIEQIW